MKLRIDWLYLLVVKVLKIIFMVNLPFPWFTMNWASSKQTAIAQVDPLAMYMVYLSHGQKTPLDFWYIFHYFLNMGLHRILGRGLALFI